MKTAQYHQDEDADRRICAEIHAIFRRLPVFCDPEQVPLDNGVYAFFEDGEQSDHGPDGRIVRIGTHPTQNGLLRRLSNHYRGSKKNSVFRKYIGGAILRRKDRNHPCLAPGPGKGHWEHQDGINCEFCRPIEREVTRIIRGTFRFRCIAVDTPDRPTLEKKLLGSLSRCPVCRPSSTWLGHHSYSLTVATSGLWNQQGVNGRALMLAEDLNFLETCVIRTVELLSVGA